jgi:hypothetical protein
MGFMDRMKEMVGQGLEVSRDLVNKAGAKAQDLGEKGVLKLEMMQLENQAQKLFGRLGLEVFSAFEERGQKTITRDSPTVREIIDELVSIQAAIEKRSEDLKKS